MLISGMLITGMQCTFMKGRSCGWSGFLLKLWVRAQPCQFACICPQSFHETRTWCCFVIGAKYSRVGCNDGVWNGWFTLFESWMFCVYSEPFFSQSLNFLLEYFKFFINCNHFRGFRKMSTGFHRDKKKWCARQRFHREARKQGSPREKENERKIRNEVHKAFSLRASATRERLMRAEGGCNFFDNRVLACPRSGHCCSRGSGRTSIQYIVLGSPCGVQGVAVHIHSWRILWWFQFGENCLVFLQLFWIWSDLKSYT